MKKLIIVSEEDVYKYDIKAIKRNENCPVWIWKRFMDERDLLKAVKKYNCIYVIGDEYLYETIALLKTQKPFSLFYFDVKYLSGEFYKRYTLRNNLEKYLYEALRTRADK